MGEFTAASLAWLERRGKANVKSLLRRLVPARPADVTIIGRMAGSMGIAEAPGPEGGWAPAPAPGPQPEELQAPAPEPDLLGGP